MVRVSTAVVRVRVQPAGVDVLLRPGGRLLDAVDALAEPPLDFGCRDASCGRCAVEVVHGADLFRPPAQDECRTLAGIRDGTPLRLGCQVRAGDRAGEVVLTPRRARPAG